MNLTYDEIYNSMAAEYESECGEKPMNYSKEERMLRAAASELYAVSAYGDFVLRQAFVQTASGEYLDRHGEMRGCQRKKGSRARAVLTFSLSEAQTEDVVIDAGTFCSASSDALIQFATTEQAIIRAGELTARAQAEAVDIGAEYNADSGSVTVLVNAPVGVQGVINEYPFTGGSDDECDSSFRQRIIENYRLPANGCSVSYAENKIKQIDGIRDCRICSSDTAGKISVCVVCDGNLSPELKIKISESIPFAELFGLSISIYKANAKNINIKALVRIGYVDDRETLRLQISAALEEILTRQKIGEAIKLDELREALFAQDGVKSADFICDAIVNDEISVNANEYIKASSAEVTLVEL